MQLPPTAEFVERTKCINCGSAHLTELSRGRYSEQPLLAFIEADPWGESPLPYLRDAEWILACCAECNQVFHRRILTNEWNEKRFSTWMSAEAMHEFESRMAGKSLLPQREFEKARRHVEHVIRIDRLTRPLRRSEEPLRILDFGCGWGDFLVACRHFGADACGVDRSTARQADAATKIFSSLDDLSGQSPFHAVTLFEVLEHLDDPAQILRQLSNVLVAGGILVLETPDCRSVTGIRSHSDYRKVHPLEHINAFTNATLKSIATRHGFTCIPRGAAHVTASLTKAIKRELKVRLDLDGRSTQLYFRKD